MLGLQPLRGFRILRSQPVYYLFPRPPNRKQPVHKKLGFAGSRLASARRIMRIIQHGFNVTPLAIKEKASGSPLNRPSLAKHNQVMFPSRKNKLKRYGCFPLPVRPKGAPLKNKKAAEEKIASRLENVFCVPRLLHFSNKKTKNSKSANKINFAYTSCFIARYNSEIKP